MENNLHDDELQPNGDDTLLARWLAGDLSAEDLEALRNLEGYPDYVEMLQALEGLEMDEYSPTLAWQKLQPILEKEKEFQRLGKCVDELLIDQRTTISLFYLEGKCYNEIVEQTGFDWNKVRSLVQNGRRNLKKCMEQNE